MNPPIRWVLDLRNLRAAGSGDLSTKRGARAQPYLMTMVLRLARTRWERYTGQRRPVSTALARRGSATPRAIERSATLAAARPEPGTIQYRGRPEDPGPVRHHLDQQTRRARRKRTRAETSRLTHTGLIHLDKFRGERGHVRYVAAWRRDSSSQRAGARVRRWCPLADRRRSTRTAAR